MTYHAIQDDAQYILSNTQNGACDEERRSGKFGTDRKGRREEKQRKEKGALDVKFEGMAGGGGCERT